MDKEKVEAIVKKYKTPKGIAFKEVLSCNHKPHPYHIGARHITYASKNCGGMLGEETCKAVRCCYPNCYLSYEEHTCDNILLFEFTGMAKNNKTTTKYFKKVLPIVEPLGIVGMNFLEPKDGCGFEK